MKLERLNELLKKLVQMEDAEENLRTFKRDLWRA